MVDYPRGKYSDCSFSHFGSIMQTDTLTHTDTDEHFTRTAVMDLSKYGQC